MVMASVEDLSLVPMVRIFSACANSIAHATVGSILHPRSNQLLPQIRDAQSGTFADTRRSAYYMLRAVSNAAKVRK